jgi:plastocyanin
MSAKVGPRTLATVLLLAAVVALLRGAHPSAQQSLASVRGRVVIDIPTVAKRPSSAYPARAVTSATLAPQSEALNVVIYLRDAPSRAVTPTRVGIRQRNETFVPRVVAVPVGSEVEFPNDDAFYHNVFSLSRPRTFNLGRYPKGETRAVRFDRPGIVKVFCDIHSHMSAAVVVFAHPWFTIPDAEGRFDIPDVPAGDQRLTAWHERLGDTTIPIRVEPGRGASVEFTLPVPAK